MLAEGLRPRQDGARALVLAAVVASAMTRVITMASSLSRVIVGTPTGVEGVACVMVAAETLTHQDHGVLPTSLRLLVDRRVPTGAL